MKARYVLWTGFFTLCVTLVCIISAHYLYRKNDDVRCSTFIKMDLSMNASQTLILDAVINIQRINGEAFLLIKGSAFTGNKKTTLSREIILSKQWEDKKKGFEYKLLKINAGPTDDTPEYIFNEFLSEISVDNNHIFLDDEIEQDDAILFGGPYADLFMCTKY